jgi:hypothetical protein
VTWTGTGSAQTISHNLGSVPGCIIVKCTSGGTDWAVYHRGLNGGVDPEDYRIYLNLTSAEANVHTFWNDTAPTSTEFTVNTSALVNDNGASYVAYLFAHNDGDGGFGPNGDQDIIKCGSYTGTGSSGNFVDLGFEPQFMLIKNTSSSANWIIHDNMRGMIETTGNVLFPNRSDAENTTAFRQARPNPTGITFFDGNSETNGSGANYIYIAIRRGPMGIPESATDVFTVVDNNNGNQTQPLFRTGFVTDMTIEKQTTGGAGYIFNRLTGPKYMSPESINAEGTSSSVTWDYMDGMGESSTGNWYSWNWRRVPSFFDIVCWNSETTSSNRRVTHNLGVAPEMVIFRRRDLDSHWYVYHKDVGTNNYLRLNTSAAQGGFTNCFNTATDTDWGYDEPSFFNYANLPMLGYFFASLAGISKVGSYTGNGSTQNIDCGFSGGARFVLIKGVDYATNWYVFDTERGIVAGNDAEMYFDSATAQSVTRDLIDPYSAGFTMTGNGVTNTSGYTYIYYAIA